MREINIKKLSLGHCQQGGARGRPVRCGDVESVQLHVCCWEWGRGQEEVKNDSYRDSDLLVEDHNR